MEEQLKSIIDSLYKKIDNIQNEHARVVKAHKEEIKKHEYAFKGICGEKLSIRNEISPTLFDQASINNRDLIDIMNRNSAKAIAHEVEKKLGDRYELEKKYSEALQYIFYLQNHAAACGIHFTDFKYKV